MAEVTSWTSGIRTGSSKWTGWVGGSKRQKRAQQFSEITKTNIGIMRDIMKQAEYLEKKGSRKDAAALLSIAEKLVENNDKIITVGGEVLDDTK